MYAIYIIAFFLGISAFYFNGSDKEQAALQDQAKIVSTQAMIWHNAANAYCAAAPGNCATTNRIITAALLTPHLPSAAQASVASMDANFDTYYHVNADRNILITTIARGPAQVEIVNEISKFSGSTTRAGIYSPTDGMVNPGPAVTAAQWDITDAELAAVSGQAATNFQTAFPAVVTRR